MLSLTVPESSAVASDWCSPALIAWATRSVVYVHLIPPGAADTVHYHLHVPENCGDQITLVAKLNYRKFSWYNTQFSFAGVEASQTKRTSSAEKLTTPDYDDRKWAFNGDLSDVSSNKKEIPSLPIIVVAEAWRMMSPSWLAVL